MDFLFQGNDTVDSHGLCPWHSASPLYVLGATGSWFTHG